MNKDRGLSIYDGEELGALFPKGTWRCYTMENHR